jgi:HSP20 family protein
MHTIIRTRKFKQPSPAFASTHVFRRPHFDCHEQTDALQLTVYVPGVDSMAIDIQVRGPDLTVTAPKSHLVRTNWRAAHLETAQRDYQLRLRLGFSLAYDALQAVVQEGVLTITIPKKTVVAAARGVA